MGAGGVHEPINLAMYNFTRHNPQKYTDPDGRVPILLVVWAAYEVGSLVYDGYNAYKTDNAPTCAAGKSTHQFVKQTGRQAGGAAKGPPNPYGKKGGSAHQAKVQEVANDIALQGLSLYMSFGYQPQSAINRPNSSMLQAGPRDGENRRSAPGRPKDGR